MADSSELRVAFHAGPLRLEHLTLTSAAAFGAEALFLGKVRDLNQGRKVVSLSYDIHPALAKRAIEEICAEAFAKWERRASLEVLHAYGSLGIGDISVIVRAETPHRREAFAMCRYVIDELKHRTPIWKKEFYVDGESQWLQGHALCQHPD